MENLRIIKFSILVLGGTLLMFPFFGFAYDDKTTHPALTQEIIKFFNNNYPDLAINDGNKEIIIQGSIDEDQETRWLHHFYDPIYNRGLVLETEGLPKDPNLALIAAGVKSEWSSAKEWAQDSTLQSGIIENLNAGVFQNYFNDAEDYSWERAIYEYAWGNEKRGFDSLGHILHLLEDMSVPDHTRNDPHPPILDYGSPYEYWTKKFDHNTIDISEILKDKKPVLLSNLNDYFDNLANYSNSNFFSKDTVLSKEYIEPQIIEKRVEVLSDGQNYLFGYSHDSFNNLIRLVEIKTDTSWVDPQYSLFDNDNLILTDYWTHLSEQAVLHGAGVIKLFFDEVEKEKQTKILYNKNRSWFEKTKDSLFGGLFNITSVLYGSSVTQKDLTENTTTPPTPTALNPQNEPDIATILQPDTQTQPPQTYPTTEVQNNNPIPSVIKLFVSSNTSSILPIAGVGGSAPTISETPESTPLPTPNTPENPSPPPPKNPPNIYLTIKECDNSISPDGCLLTNPAINLAWSSDTNNLNHYIIECSLNNNPCPEFNFSNTTATATTYKLPQDNSIYTFRAQAVDNDNNESQKSTKTVEFYTRPIVINEVAWAGTGSSATTSRDEWIELFNVTDKSINLDNWVLYAKDSNKPYIQLTNSIAPKSYYLLERADDTAVNDTSTNLVYGNNGSAWSLNNNPAEKIILSYASTTIDQTPLCGLGQNIWCGGSTANYSTMERYDVFAPGEESKNWGSWAGFVANGKNADGQNISGTPKKRNDISYLIAYPQAFLDQNKTLTQENSPYFIDRYGFTINRDYMLTLEPGVVLKFLNNASTLTAEGAVKAEGTEENPIIFTSFQDDSAGGDINQDATSTIPNAGDWSSIILRGPNTVLDHTIIRYGGATQTNKANLIIESVATSIKNSIIEKSAQIGLWLKSASGLIERNIIRNNGTFFTGTGIFMQAGNSEIKNNTMSSSGMGIRIESGNTSAVENNTFNLNARGAIEVANAGPTFSGNSASGNGINGILLGGNSPGNYTLSPDLPYVINSEYNVALASTLTILPGTIFKLTQSYLNVYGKILAQGEESNTIIFTSLSDDSVGGDTNNDGTSTLPYAGEWNALSFPGTINNQKTGTSTFSYTQIRYGGSQSYRLGAIQAFAGAELNINNSTIENNTYYGISLDRSSFANIINSVIQNHREPLWSEAFGLFLTASSSAFIQNTVFQNNRVNIFNDNTSSIINGGGNTPEIP